MTYQLTIEPLGQTIDIAEGQTVLDACLRAGVWLPHACGHGLCGPARCRRWTARSSTAKHRRSR
jgi:phenol hydroxylase P5 protein